MKDPIDKLFAKARADEPYLEGSGFLARLQPQLVAQSAASVRRKKLLAWMVPALVAVLVAIGLNDLVAHLAASQSLFTTSVSIGSWLANPANLPTLLLVLIGGTLALFSSFDAALE